MQTIRTPTAIFFTIIEALRRSVAEQGHLGAFTMICRGYASTGMFTSALFNRLNRIRLRFDRLVQRLETEAPRPFPPARNPRGPAPARAPRPVKPEPSIPPWDPEHPTFEHLRPIAPTPRTFAWLLVVMKHHAAAHESHLTNLFFQQPETRALLASDYRFGRILRPLCHMLGMKLPPELQPRKPAPGIPEPATPAISEPAPPEFRPPHATRAPSGARISLSLSHPEPRAPPLKIA